MEIMGELDSYCTDCMRDSGLIFDHAAGETLCSECGLVLESKFTDQTSEWRTFADDDSGGDHDLVRVGAPLSPLLGDAGLSTFISRAPNCSNGDFSRLQSRSRAGAAADPHRAIVLAFEAIASMADRLGIVATIKDRASEIYKKLEDQKCTSRGRNLEALVAACIYTACRQEGKPRTMKEICSAANGATKKDIARARELIVKHVKVETGESMDMGTIINAGDYLRRFCSNLDMSNEEFKAVQETVEKSEAFDIRRSPVSIAAAIILMITKLSDSRKPSLREISVATTVAEITIKNAYKDLLPHAHTIVPHWFAKEKDLNTLPNRFVSPVI